MINSYPELRKALNDYVVDTGHPYKNPPRKVTANGTEIERPNSSRRPYKVVYFDNGTVGCCVEKDGERVYLIASGEDHADGVLALCHHLGLTKISKGDLVEEVSAETYWLLCCGGPLPS